ncbi:TetR family transcriptional regulator [Paenibacillus sp. HWE-109]|uniref:acyl-CoA-like ligand-binding transcription factor n=1 Tax=Paenibacillus sp. HWE-109 TaxID=1306526 RepID=UPI001EDF4D6F|nr:TetR family transcriptional regulator [Paenibacillus sp. HWE-109]UKS28931.1 TetR family transcriptional regulator [Paenibacillus sp. HWE-109]
MLSEQAEPVKIGLREKKKQKTRSMLQQQALRLFHEQGYHATTIEQIAEASEISLSTLFRYFSTKEALVIEDEFDPMIIHEFQKQPLDLNPIQALRVSLKAVFESVDQDRKEALHERTKLISSVPELRAASLIQTNESLLLIAKLVADRLHRTVDDLEILTFAGSVTGAMMAVQLYCASHPEASYVDSIDEALSNLELGLPLSKLTSNQ